MSVSCLVEFHSWKPLELAFSRPLKTTVVCAGFISVVVSGKSLWATVSHTAEILRKYLAAEVEAVRKNLPVKEPEQSPSTNATSITGASHTTTLPIHSGKPFTVIIKSPHNPPPAKPAKTKHRKKPTKKPKR